MKRILTATLSSLLLMSPMGPSGASEGQIEGSFTAEAAPAPLAWPVTQKACDGSGDGLHRVTKPLEAPFSGWLFVSAEFSGDWDLALYGAAGDGLAWSEHQFSTDEPKEIIWYFLRKGQTVDIAACNVASASNAEVRYVLTSGRPWLQPVGKGFDIHVERLHYRSPSVGTNDHWFLCLAGMELGCAGTKAVRPSDRFVYVEISDDVEIGPGQAIAADVYQYSGYTYLGEEQICTRTDEPIKLKPGVDFVGVSILLGPCENGDPAAGTQGEIDLIFSNRRG